MTGALEGLRNDLFRDPFAYRLLGPLAADGPVTGRLPRLVRGPARWLPHALVALASLIVLAYTYGASTSAYSGPGFLFTGLVPVVAMGLTLARPVAAFWVSLLAAPAGAIVVGGWHGGPWSPPAFFAHVVVLTVVAARTRPRTAAWMWALTGLAGLFTESLFGTYGGPMTPQLLFAAAMPLLVVTAVQTRRDARKEVTAQRTVTAQERSMRTLLEERTTIARELHDVVAHHMSVVAIQAEAAPYRVENPPPELEQAFATIRENAVAALTELRRVLGVVRAEDYQAPDAPQPTLADLDGLLDNVRDAGLAVEKTVTGAIRELPQGVELSAYRIVQEALSNVLRHAPGASARVELSYVLGGLGLRVVNGPPRGLVKPTRRPTATPQRGLRPHHLIGAGHGITGMRERVTMLNGELTAEAAEDGGYEVAAFIPVAREEVQ